METIGIAGIKTDCIFFKGDLPCAPHKKSGVHCPDCPSYQAIETRFLIFKLGAIGDVIRTHPLLRKIRKECILFFACFYGIKIIGYLRPFI